LKLERKSFRKIFSICIRTQFLFETIGIETEKALLILGNTDTTQFLFETIGIETVCRSCGKNLRKKDSIPISDNRE